MKRRRKDDVDDGFSSMNIQRKFEFLGVTITAIIDGVLRLYKAGIHKIDKADSETIASKLDEVLLYFGVWI